MTDDEITTIINNKITETQFKVGFALEFFLTNQDFDLKYQILAAVLLLEELTKNAEKTLADIHDKFPEIYHKIQESRNEAVSNINH